MSKNSGISRQLKKFKIALKCPKIRKLGFLVWKFLVFQIQKLGTFRRNVHFLSFLLILFLTNSLQLWLKHTPGHNSIKLVKFERLNFWWCRKKTPPVIKLMILWVYAKFNFRCGQRKTRLLSLVDDFITFKHFWILKKIPYLDITKNAQISMFTSMFGKHTYFDIFVRCIMSKNSGIFGHEFLYIKLYITEKVRQKI